MSLSAMVSQGEGKSFKSFGLDARLLQGVKKMGFKTPTLIQESAIPLALAGKDVLARASTGSGKTAAYSIPVAQKLLVEGDGAATKITKALILVPTKELCHQVADHFQKLVSYCSGALAVVDLAGVEVGSWSGQRANIVVGTPMTTLAHVKEGNISLKHLSVCVVDEADALLGHPVVRRLRCMYPTTAQAMLMSATLSPQVLELKRLLLNRPVTVKLEDEDEEEEPEGKDDEARKGDAGEAAANQRIKQYYVPCLDDSDKFCYLYGLIRLKYLEGKVLVFVDNIDKAYKIKLFLEKFAIGAAVLNSDIPLNSRNHIVAQFNTGEFNFLIATDESVKKAQIESKKKSKSGGDKDEYGVSRGIDFREVAGVVNFDVFAALEESACKSYIHRIGRTGRGGREGVAISLVHPDDTEPGGWLEYLNAYLESRGQAVVPHITTDKEREDILSLKYRTNDAHTSIKRKTVKEAKVKELVREAMASDVIKKHFSENPNDLQALKHVVPKTGAEATAAASMNYIPSYLTTKAEAELDLNAKRSRDDEESEDDDRVHVKKSVKKKKRTQSDPLASFSVGKKGSKKVAESAGPAKKKKKTAKAE